MKPELFTKWKVTMAYGNLAKSENRFLRIMLMDAAAIIERLAMRLIETEENEFLRTADEALIQSIRIMNQANHDPPDNVVDVDSLPEAFNVSVDGDVKIC